MEKTKFDDPAIEEIYQDYSLACKQAQLFPAFLVGALLYSATQLGVHLYWWLNLKIRSSDPKFFGQAMYFYIITFLCLTTTICSAILWFVPVHVSHAQGNKAVKRRHLAVTYVIPPHLMVILWSATVLLSVFLRVEESVPLRLGLGWVILEIFLILVTLPLRFRVVVTYSFVLACLHTAAVLWKGRAQPLLWEQLTANLILLFGVHCLGILGFNQSETRQRRTFEDSRQSLEVKDVMDSHTEEQQRLFLSVLPKHLAETMTQETDSAEAGSGAFKKIYMERHEPVSILFADIVGFTAMSAALGSASKLVEILDELFSMFDSLAEQHSQVRIKILGDCYYCICGAPEERPDHAILCVHMGLAVVEAIKYFQKRTNTAVDMRVGIHTGAVLAGILGQRQWQFDVYSKDVDLANLMESGGIPGKVHISDKTLSFLNNEFEVEPGFGETREEGLRLAGIKTYFITKVLKPVKSSEAAAPSSTDKQSRKKSEGAAGSDHKRLRRELLSHDGISEISKHANGATLRFRNKAKETEYSARDPSADQTQDLEAYIGCSCAILTLSGTSFLVISFTWSGLIAGLVGFIILYSLGTVAQRMERNSKRGTKRLNNLFAVIVVAVLTVANLVLMIPCFEAGNQIPDTNTTVPSVDFSQSEPWSKLGCAYPTYLVVFCASYLLSATILSNIYFWLVSLVALFALAVHSLIINLAATSFQASVRASETFSFGGQNDLVPETLTWTIFTAAFFFAFFSLTRRLELTVRIQFLCKSNLAQQKERATALRLRNEVLMCNIMPEHVANHFLNTKNQNAGLYSENYLEAGVIFAAMPNFRDFYTEDAVNNQGLECLRFLNEVISDYDGLLDLPKYEGQIIKIKTIGSTYMAASGLNPTKQCKADDSFKERWRHLAFLVEFALDMKRVLHQINEQSYNQFVLKIGINHGPITAGVIGNTKPAYDIWGNTANVSSRMYSTGKADKIQVTDETYKILRIYGYTFERRGFISVKGKGEILTYFLTGTGPELTDEQIEQLELDAHD